MKFCTFELVSGGEPRLGIENEGSIIDVQRTWLDLPATMLDFLDKADEYLQLIHDQFGIQHHGHRMNEVKLLPPLPVPRSFRDFMGFAEHVETSRKLRGQTVDPFYYQTPVFYYSNTLNMLGPDEAVRIPDTTRKFDFEFEVGVVLGKGGRDLNAEQAEACIFGFTILNDWSLRDVQFEEMKIGLGPAKGKDYATSMGPFIVSKDELEPHREGTRYNLNTRLYRNRELLRENNLNTIHHDFVTMIMRASENTTLYPGELIGSGTIGGGCLVEYQHLGQDFLKPEELIQMEVEGIGSLFCPVAED